MRPSTTNINQELPLFAEAISGGSHLLRGRKTKKYGVKCDFSGQNCMYRWCEDLTRKHSTGKTCKDHARKNNCDDIRGSNLSKNSESKSATFCDYRLYKGFNINPVQNTGGFIISTWPMWLRSLHWPLQHLLVQSFESLLLLSLLASTRSASTLLFWSMAKTPNKMGHLVVLDSIHCGFDCGKFLLIPGAKQIHVPWSKPSHGKYGLNCRILEATQIDTLGTPPAQFADCFAKYYSSLSKIDVTIMNKP